MNHYTPPEPHPLSIDEVAELASICVAMLETKGQLIDVTLSEMSAEAGGFVLPEDARRVRESAESLLAGISGKWEWAQARSAFTAAGNLQRIVADPGRDRE